MGERKVTYKSKEKIAKAVNGNCIKASCFICKEADKYEDYTKCPFLALKQIARERKVTADDVPDNLIEA